MTPHKITTTSGSDGVRDGVGFTAVEREPEFSGPGSAGAACWLAGSTGGTVAAGNVTAAGVASSRRDWIVPVTSGASRATFQSRSRAAGSSWRLRVANQATPRSAVLWIKYVSSHASTLEAMGG